MEILEKDGLEEKLGEKSLLVDFTTLTDKLNYEEGIVGFDKLLHGKTLKDIGGVIHISKYPRGISIVVAKQYKDYSVGILFSEIQDVSIKKNKLLFHLDSGTSISFSFKKNDLFEIREFINKHILTSETSPDSQSNDSDTKTNKSTPYISTLILTVLFYLALIVALKRLFQLEIVQEFVDSAGIWGELIGPSMLFIGAGSIGWFVAKLKKRNSWLWAILCIFFQIFGIIAIALISFKKESNIA